MPRKFANRLPKNRIFNATKSVIRSESTDFMNKVDTKLLELIKKAGDLVKSQFDSNSVVIVKANSIINFVLAVFIVTYIIFQTIYIVSGVSFIIGWMYIVFALIIPLFIFKLLTTFSIFFNDIVKEEKNYTDPLVFSNYMLLVVKEILSNFSTTMPTVMLFGFLYSCFKLLPISKDYINTPIIFFVFSLFSLFIIFSCFLKRLFANSSNIMSKIFLYLFMFCFIIFILIFLISKFMDTMLNAILVKIESINEEDETDDEDIKYKLSKRLKDDYVILQDIPDFKDISGFAYLMSIISLIFILIFDGILIYFFNKPGIVININKLLTELVNKIYEKLQLDDKMIK